MDRVLTNGSRDVCYAQIRFYFRHSLYIVDSPQYLVLIRDQTKTENKENETRVLVISL